MPTNGQDRIDQDKIEEEYGLSYALFQAFPELKELLRKAVNGNWSPSKFQVELRQTQWFKKHSDVWRETTALKFSDPSTYRERLANSMTAVQNLAGSFGARLGALKRLAERALLFGMSDDQIRDVLANHIKPSEGGHYSGQLSGIEQDLQSLAARNGVRVGKKQLQNWMKSIVRGDASQQQFEQHIRDLAAQTFGAYGDQIRSGIDLIDAASPYMQSMTEILELNPGALDLYDPTLRRAMTGTRNDKNEVVPMSLTDFEDQLRKDRRWQYTQNAREQAMGFTSAISKMWGLS
jgi:hypothetical protein